MITYTLYQASITYLQTFHNHYFNCLSFKRHLALYSLIYELLTCNIVEQFVEVHLVSFSEYGRLHNILSNIMVQTVFHLCFINSCGGYSYIKCN